MKEIKEATTSEYDLKLAVAKRIFFNEHPRSDWLKYPNYTQNKRQERYLLLAAAIIIQVREADAAN